MRDDEDEIESKNPSHFSSFEIRFEFWLALQVTQFNSILQERNLAEERPRSE